MSSSTFFCVSGSKRCSGGGCCEQSPRRKLHHSNPELGSLASATSPEYSIRKSHSLDWGVAGAAPQPLPLPESSLIQRPDAVPKQGHGENQVATTSISVPLASYSGCIHPDENACGGCFNFCLPTKTQANDISSHIFSQQRSNTVDGFYSPAVSPRITNAAADPLPSFWGPPDHYQDSFPSRLSPKGQSRSLGRSPLHSPPSRSQRFNPKGSNGTAVTESSSERVESSSRINAHPLPLPPPPQSSIMHNNAESLPISSIKGQWKKGKLIGRGTLGSVYLATNRQTGALCAMKEVDLIPDDPKSAECVKQLEQEIKILRTLKHPNIVQYYGSEVIDNHFCTYLEYVYIRPGAIDKYVQDHIGAMTESVVRNFTRHILSGLALLHGTKIIHRDIRGANLRLDASGVVKIVNFGIAKHLNRQSDNVSLKGSPNWMAPEVIRTAMQNNADPDLSLAVDIWSLGCTIIEMFTGKPPWSECTGPQVMFKMLNRIPDIPETLSAEGKDFLHWCFRRDPAKRPSAAELLEHPFEIKILRTLKHPNIVQYYGSEVIDNHFCTYLEYVYIRPGAIDKYVQDHIGAMTESVVRNFTRHILSGLALLHGTKIIHRDIRGANLRLDASGVVKIVNFGIAKHLNRQSDNVSLKGSPNWMAPEVIRTAMQNNADPDLSLAVDIWSLGCTIIAMFTGKPPWSECTGPQVMFMMLNRIPDIPETLSAEGKDFLHWCFRRDPAKRPSAAELLEHPFVHAQNP